MSVDKNLFLYDLSVVAIMKNEAPYVKEWIDYHLLAGVEHFYIYDNDSPDDLMDMLAPYIEKNIVTYIFYPGKARQYECYNEAMKNFKFFSRYLAFIDGDEFIFPQENKSIVEVLDEIFAKNPNAGGLGINWQLYGSNFNNTANYTRGVLKGFTHRAEKNFVEISENNNLPAGNAHIKTVANPRKIKGFENCHYAIYFTTANAINSNGDAIQLHYNNPPLTDKIVINHYCYKSIEEYELKISRGPADGLYNVYQPTNENWKETYHKKFNDVFDDRILNYRDSRQELNSPLKNIDREKLLSALLKNLSPTFIKDTPKEFYQGKMETFLTCLALSGYLKNFLHDEQTEKFFEEASLNAIHRTMITNLSMVDVELLLDELPNILKFKYPAVKNIIDACLVILPQIKNFFKINWLWRDFVEHDNLFRLLETIKERGY